MGFFSSGVMYEWFLTNTRSRRLPAIWVGGECRAHLGNFSWDLEGDR